MGRVFKIPPTSSFSVSRDAVLDSCMPVFVVLCVVVGNIPVIFSVVLEEFDWRPLVCAVVKEVVPSSGVVSVVKWVKDDLVFNVCWKVVF